MTLSEIKSVYFVGAGGIGMSAIARYFLGKGLPVAGYDKTPSKLTQDLEREGMDIHYEEDVNAIPHACRDPKSTLVIYTPAIPDNHQELVFFREQGFEIEKRAQVLGRLTQAHKGLCVAGTHGKTTTSKIITERLKKFGYSSKTISLDNFLVPLAERKVLNDGSLDYDSFSTINVELFNSFIKDLFRYQKAEMPIYNFVKNRPEDFKETVEISGQTILIIEGLHALNPDLFTATENKNLSYKIYIAPNVDFYLNDKLVLNAKTLRLMRRSLRDYYKRGANIEQTFKTWNHTVESENLYIKPYKTTVDYIINSTLRYELLLYAKYLKPILLREENSEKLFDLLKPLEALATIEKDLVPADSMLWEFLTK